MKTIFKNIKTGWVGVLGMLLASFVLLVGCKEVYPGVGSIPDNTPPSANFSYAQLSSSDYLEVTFTNLSASSTDYLWDFGDGTTSIEDEPVHTYAADGLYTISLTSSDKLGVVANATKEIELTEPAAYVPPILESSFEDGQLSGATGDGRDSWRNSDLGGVIQITSSPTVTGSQAAKLTGDPSDMRIGYQLITVTENTVYDVKFFYTMKDNTPGSLTFAVLDGPVSSHADALDAIIGATTVNDQTDPSSYVVETFSFYSGSNTEVALYFFNDGSAETRIDDVSIDLGTGPVPALASFSFEEDASNYMTIDFTNASVNADSYSWDFGDGSTSMDMNPSHTYALDSTYTVTLTASNVDGGTDMVSHDVTIAAPLSVAINNPSLDDEIVKDDNRTAWRNVALETDADTYISASDYMLQMSTTNRTGTWSGKLPTAENSSKPRRWMYQAIQVNPNTSYDISAYIRNKDSYVGSTVTFQVYDAPFNTASTIDDTGYILSAADFDASTGHDTNVFTQATINFNSGTSTEVVLFISNDYTLNVSGENSESFVDDVSITEL
tara:strand:- start:402 stop:2060 length:1659 start_codon:yes stop_codon:yes gene_type:complete